ncbi:tRNA lysidine(34) synthetase TilS [Haploplasma axanthum]|nr:tRNA lysidine(34) synthetase TilS [Haploplasma axanthum]
MLNITNLLSSFKIDKKIPIIVAVSGGIDSMVLLNILITEKYKPIVVHFNHNTRKTNERDQDLIINFSKNNNLIYHIFSININEGNFQSEARDLRYEKLRMIAKKYKTSYIATAHHLDDLAETILIKMTRGSNLYGYSGIQPLYVKDEITYIRPLLNIDKKTIIDYALLHKIPYFTDESNYSDNYLRNRYRHTVIPILKQENQQFLKKVYNFHTQLKDAASYIKNQALKELHNNSINIENFKKLDVVIQKEMIAILFEQDNLETTFETIDKIRCMLLNDSPNQEYTLENKYTFIKAYNEAFIKKNQTKNVFDITLNDSLNILPNMEKITFFNNPSNIDNETVKICYNKLSLPLRARTRKPGDTLSFKYGRKKLKDYLIDLKLPKYERDKLWLITDSNDIILWVSNIYINETLGSEKQLQFLWEKGKNEQRY